MDTHMDGYIRVRSLLTAPLVASPSSPATTENEHRETHTNQDKNHTKQADYIASYGRLDAHKLRL